MAHRLRLVAFAVAAFACTAAHSAYVSPAPPVGFSGTPGNWTFAPPTATDQIDKIMRQGGSGGLRVPIPGPPVTVTVGYKLKAAAGRVAAAAIFANPYVRTAVGIATWLGIGKVVYDSATGKWTTPDPSATTSDGKEYMVGGATALGWRPSSYQACQAYAQSLNVPSRKVLYKNVEPYGAAGFWCNYTTQSISNNGTLGPPQEGQALGGSRTSACPAGWFITPAGCTQTAQPKVLTQQEMVDLLNPDNQPGWPMPQTVPGELPKGTPLPIEDPVFNPSPGPNPTPRPLFVPTGDPVPNPNYDPNAAPSPTNQPYTQPGVRITPSPTPGDPFRVDVQPVNRPVPTADPAPEPQPEDDPNPSDKPKPEEQQSLCEKHPDVVACAKTGDVEAVPVPNEDKPLSINKDGGYGPESGTCPQPKTATVMGQSLAFKYDLICDFAGYIKPIVIAFAWLSAALTFFGFSRKDS